MALSVHDGCRRAAATLSPVRVDPKARARDNAGFSGGSLVKRPTPELRVSRPRGTLPAQPVDDTLAHDAFEVAAFQPRQFLGEHRHALPVAAWHAGDVGAPEE